MKLDRKSLMERAGLREDDQPIRIAGKEVDRNSWTVSGVDRSQGQDDGTTDAYFEDASFVDGTPLNDQQIEQLNDKHYDKAIDYAVEHFHEF